MLVLFTGAEQPLTCFTPDPVKVDLWITLVVPQGQVRFFSFLTIVAVDAFSCLDGWDGSNVRFSFSSLDVPRPPGAEKHSIFNARAAASACMVGSLPHYLKHAPNTTIENRIMRFPERKMT